MHKLLEREKVNPAEEFKNDPMMRELHLLRAINSEYWKKQH